MNQPFASIPAEQGAIGCVLLDANCVDAIDLPLEAFTDLRHREIMRAARHLRGTVREFDLIAVQQFLRDKKLLDQIGGIAYLSVLQDKVPSVANLPHYLGILREKFQRRRIVDTGAKLIKLAESTPIDDLLFVAQSDLADVLSPPQTGPQIISASDFMAAKIPAPAEIINGVLHRGSKMVLGGVSKSNKTWSLLDLAISVSCGADWLSFHTSPGKVLFINLEVQNHPWQYRLRTVSEAKQIVVNANLMLLNYRGNVANFHTFIPKIIEATRGQDYSLIVIDPIYMIYGQTDENSARDTGELMNELERLATISGAAIVFAAHFAKGNAAGKSAQDRISGSGVFARAPDTIAIFTEHENENAFIVEFVLRNFPRVPTFTVRWMFPLMQLAEELDPSKLKQSKPGAKPKHDILELLRLIADRSAENAISVSEWSALAGTNRTTLHNYVREMRAAGWIETVGEGSKARQSITALGREKLAQNNT